VNLSPLLYFADEFEKVATFSTTVRRIGIPALGLGALGLGAYGLQQAGQETPPMTSHQRDLQLVESNRRARAALNNILRGFE